MVDVAKLPSEPASKVYNWLITWLKPEPSITRLDNVRLLSTDEAFAKFRHPDGRITMIAVHAIVSISALAHEA